MPRNSNKDRDPNQMIMGTFRIKSQIWDDFKNIAEKNQTNASALLIRYIQGVVTAGDIPQNKSSSPQPCLDDDAVEQLIGEKVDDCYQSMMTHLNELQSQVYALEQKMISKNDDISEKVSDSNDQPPIERSHIENIRTTLKRKGTSATTEQIRAAFVAAGWDGSNYQEIRKDILERLS